MSAPPSQASAADRPSTRGDMTERGVEPVRYGAPRLTLPIPAIREFQTRYETAVPDLPLAAVAGLVSRRAPWSEMVELIDGSAPRGFLICFRNDVHPVIALAALLDALAVEVPPELRE